jgi:hypothetical protein
MFQYPHGNFPSSAGLFSRGKLRLAHFLLQCGTKFRVVFSYLFLFCVTEFRVVFSSTEWFRMEFREFAEMFVSQNIIPSNFFLCGMVRNGIFIVFCSAEQPEFRRNKPIVPAIPSSAE